MPHGHGTKPSSGVRERGTRLWLCARAGRSRPKEIQWTPRGAAQLLDDVGVDHGRFHVRVAEVFLNLSDVDAVEQQMGRKAVAQRVYRHWLMDLRATGGDLDGLLDDRVAQVMAPDNAGARVGRQGVTRKDPEPPEFATRVGVLALQTSGSQTPARPDARSER